MKDRWARATCAGTAALIAVAGTVAGGSVRGASASTTLAQVVSQPTATTDTLYTVLAEDGVAGTAVARAIGAAGGRITALNRAVGMYTVRAAAKGFLARIAESDTVLGAAHARPIGTAPKHRITGRTEGVRVTAVPRPRRADGLDPLDGWNMRMVHADQARRVQSGNRGVTVGVIDTGVDASHPDIAPHFSAALSRNFAPDIPSLDGPCEVRSCVDPVGTDDDGHGTHVAGTIAAAADGYGVSGVAPNVTLVELKAGHDAGYFFVDSVVNALTYAADAGIDVVNMSFYVDPWLYNCLDNPADSTAAKSEQRTIVAAMNRALTYARRGGVTLVAAMGNENEDVGHPQPDTGSPDYPLGKAYPRTIDNDTCFQFPLEGPGVIGVSALGPSGRKADYSSYGRERISVAAPGGWFRDGYGTPSYRTAQNMVLSALPRSVLQREGAVDAAGKITPNGAADGVQRACHPDGRCGYYGYLQGTSMASPHAAGVAALIVSQYGHRDPRRPGLTMAPALVERRLRDTAAEHACPAANVQSYAREGRATTFTATCKGSRAFNGFYGYGIVNAYAAVTRRG